MNNQPQQILVRVDCKETKELPVYEVLCEDIVGEKLFGNLNLSQLNGYVCESEETLLRDVIAWYEPATRIVLTAEEWEEMKRKADLYDNSAKRYDDYPKSEPL